MNIRLTRVIKQKNLDTLSRGLLRRNTLTRTISCVDYYCSVCSEFWGVKVMEVHESSRSCFVNQLMVVGGVAERVGGSNLDSGTVPPAG